MSLIELSKRDLECILYWCAVYNMEFISPDYDDELEAYLEDKLHDFKEE